MRARGRTFAVTWMARNGGRTHQRIFATEAEAYAYAKQKLKTEAPLNPAVADEGIEVHHLTNDATHGVMCFDVGCKPYYMDLDG